jgi:RNA polymerase sigma-70 factor (ECF subfamily)
MARPENITELLRAWSDGDHAAYEALVPLVEAELHRLARSYMARERRDHTLQATALVNEACLRLAGTEGIEWRDRAHFLGIAARLMRRVLIDHARRHAFQKRGGGLHKVPIDEERLATEPRDLDLLALDRALESLAAVDARKAKVVEMRYFGGMTIEETAGALRVSIDTVKRDWQVARMWLLRALEQTT